MNESNPNGPASPKDADQVDKSDDMTTVSFDEYFEFEENGSQPASAWPWPEPAFIRESKQTPPKV
jgi:hypothetical protein